MTPAGESVGADMPSSGQTDRTWQDPSPPPPTKTRVHGQERHQLSRAEMGPVQIHTQEENPDGPTSRQKEGTPSPLPSPPAPYRPHSLAQKLLSTSDMYFTGSVLRRL